MTLALESRAQRLALDERHDVVELSVGAAGIKEWQDVRVLQARRELDLLEKPLGAEHGRELGVQHLERHLAAVPNVLGQIDRGHAPGTELSLDPVAVGDRRAESRYRVGHELRIMASQRDTSTHRPDTRAT